MAAKGSGRLFHFENVSNFRQAGGLNVRTTSGKKVKDGVLYRSSNLHYASANDMNTLQRLGIRTVLDLRSTADYLRYSKKGNQEAAARFEVYTAQNGEVKPLREAAVSKSNLAAKDSNDDSEEGELRKRGGHPTGEKEGKPTCMGRHYITDIWSTERGLRHGYSQLGFFSKLVCFVLKAVDIVCKSNLVRKFVSLMIVNHLELWEHYRIMSEHSTGAIAQSLRIVAEKENLPILIKCAAGKDRTGIIVALVLGCVGVDEETIIQDYAESHNNLGPVEKKFLEKAAKMRVRADYVWANPETMRKFLNHLKESYGGIHGYLDSIGFCEEEQENLKKILLID
jgi:protein tyrosine/serine phosphatase